ncbi:hypothetical protein HWV62_34747 [Athelia sp. TMB]|nr:hypothetical protein HWV62_34747 [Athelia sp. TMB]
MEAPITTERCGVDGGMALADGEGEEVEVEADVTSSSMDSLRLLEIMKDDADHWAPFCTLRVCEPDGIERFT